MSEGKVEVAVVGGGRMGMALVGGLVGAGRDPSGIVVVEQDAERRAALAGRWPAIEVAAELRATSVDGVVLAVKPADGERACRAVSAAGALRLCSVLAGVPCSVLERWAGAGTAVLRAMPNTPALVGAAATALCRGSTADDGDVAWARSVLGSVGVVVEVAEAAMDAVTGLSGSGPAYIALVAEALIEAGVLQGLPREVSTALVLGTLSGTARLLTEAGDPPGQVRADVTSPGGTTAAGLQVLEDRAVRGAFLAAVTAAAERSRALGRD